MSHDIRLVDYHPSSGQSDCQEPVRAALKDNRNEYEDSVLSRFVRDATGRCVSHDSSGAGFHGYGTVRNVP